MQRETQRERERERERPFKMRGSDMPLPSGTGCMCLRALHVEGQILHGRSPCRGHTSVSNGHSRKGRVGAAVDNDECVVVCKDSV